MLGPAAPVLQGKTEGSELVQLGDGFGVPAYKEVSKEPGSPQWGMVGETRSAGSNNSKNKSSRQSNV